MKPYITKAAVAAICLLGSSQILPAQQQKTWQWVSQLGSKSWDVSGGLACNLNNKLFVTGSFIDTLVCDGRKTASAGGRDIFIARYDSKGKLEDLWSAGGAGGDQASCIALSKDNSVLIGGQITGNVRFDNLTDQGEGDRLFISRLTDKGKFSWISTLLPSGAASLFLIGSDATGNVYAAGVFSGSLVAGDHSVNSSGNKDIFLIKLNAGGEIQKLIAFGGIMDDIPTAMSVSDSGKIILAGTAGKTFNLRGMEIQAAKQNPNSEVNSDAFVIGFNADFEPLWNARIKGDEYCQVSSLGQDKNGNVFAAGSFNLNIRVGESLLTSGGYSDGFLIKYSVEGKLSWARSFGSWYYDYARNMVIDNMGGALVTGSMGDTLTVDSLTVNPLSANNSALALQFSPQGKAIWADCLSGSGRNFGEGAVIDRLGNLYLTGTFRDKFTKENASLTSLGDQDVFLAKYYNCQTARAEIIGDTILCPGSATQLSIGMGYKGVVWCDTINNTDYIDVQAPGKYHVTMFDKRGCVLNDTVEIIIAQPQQLSLGDDTSIPLEGSLLLRVPDHYSDINWQDGSSEATFLAKAENKAPGTYTFWLSAIDSLGCSVTDTINVEFFSASGGADLSHVQMQVYPNPVGDLLYWSVTSEEPCQFVVEITDDNGRTLYNNQVKNYVSNTQMTIDFSDIPAGAYYLRLKNYIGQTFNSVSIIRK